jgi:sulfite exporter TauE/SafE
MNLLAAFFLGLAGSLHCAAMCGPLIVAVNSVRRQDHANPAAPGRTDILNTLAYHLGRLLTYCLLGAISGLIGAAIVFAGFQRWISIGAGCLILLGTLASFRASRGGISGRVVSAVKTRFGPLLRKRTLGAAVLLGGLNGMLPCGLVYIACAAAAVAGGIGGGVATMLVFGLGTAPMLLSIGLVGKAVRWSNPLRLRRVVLGCVTLVGVLLIVRGLSLGIPYLSPHFSNGEGPACCHQNL